MAPVPGERVGRLGPHPQRRAASLGLGPSAAQFKEMFIDAMKKQTFPRDQLTLRDNRSGPMKAKKKALKLVDLGVLGSHSRPLTPNDNPFSEAHTSEP